MAQTLAGHLEDLDLDEVVRVIALSQRSGVLALETAEGNAELFFLEGRVVSARLYDADETVAEILMVADVLEPGDLPNDAHALTPHTTVDDVLRAAEEKRDDDGRSLATRADEVLSERLSAATEKVLSYRHGRFSFQVTDEEGPPPRYPQDTAITVAGGIDALEIASDHKQHRLSGVRDRAVRKGFVPRRGPELAHVFLAFDDDAFIEEIGRAAAPLGIHCEPVRGARGGIETLNSMSGPAPKILVVDLVMSRPDGRGILGGLEVLRAASDEGVIDRLFLARDHAHRDADQLAMAMGALGTLEKPDLEKNGAVNGERPDTATFFNPILRALGREPLVDKPIDIVDALREELGQDAPEEWQRLAQESPEKGRSLSVLKGLLGELNDPSFEEEIPLLVLRFSSAFFSRGALFHIDEQKGELAGIGGFGISQKDAGRAIHATRIPLASNNLFARSLREKLGVRQPFFDSEWNTYLLNSLGGPRPREVYTAPLLSARGLEAVLYADNALDLRPFPDIALLEIFLQQSGAAIERWALKQRLQAIEGE